MISGWAQEEMAGADFGDERLDARAAILLSAMGNRPNLSIPAACGGHAEMQAAYRFFDNDKVSLAQVLAPHIERTVQRMARQPVVLLVQDTTEIDLTRPQQQVAGAGELDGSRRGILLHEMQAFTADGTPLGTVWAEGINRVEGVSHAPKAQKQKRCKQRPIEQKESMRWLTGLRRGRELAQKLPQVQCVCLADSEADIYECFAEPRGGPLAQVDWLVRACQNRALEAQGDGGHQCLHEQVLSAQVLYEVELLIRGRQAKTAVEDRQRRQNRQSRQARVEVRAATVTLRPPQRGDRRLPPATVNVVLVQEPDPPSGEPAVEWILVTTLPIQSLEQVRRVVEYYCVRWSIEILFRTLKSGCRIERRRFEDVQRVWPCLGLCLIVAWRTLFLCRMGRECPEVDCEAVFEPSEWKAVWTAVHHKKPPKKRPRLREMVHLVGRLGGYVERRASEPGPQTVWIGLQRMYDLTWAWETFGPEARLPRC
jgi:hypothetical protein